VLPVETRQAALCIFHRNGVFLIAEIVDPHSGAVLHRPPGGGIEEGETPEQTVRREVLEELGITLTEVRQIGHIDHVWIWKSRELHERAYIFLADPADDPRLNRGETLELIEADGERSRTIWLALDGAGAGPPPICPAGLPELLRSPWSPTALL
jgi:8-oxo-dGTP pyrophosphatase MutT (NUDIX family)